MNNNIKGRHEKSVGGDDDHDDIAERYKGVFVYNNIQKVR